MEVNRADTPHLKADCGQCVALCCMAFAFDHSEMFAIDKAAGEACRHLGAEHGCSIHDGLREKGFAGCAQYDCLGAGQRVTQEVFAGRSWRDDPKLVHPMMEAFRVMRTIHELIELLRTAKLLSLTQIQAQQIEVFESLLCPLEGWSESRLNAFEQGGDAQAVRAFFTTLRANVSRG